MCVEPLRPVAHAAEHAYATPAREFRLSYFDLSGRSIRVGIEGPEIWLVTEGAFELASAQDPALCLARGRSAFVSANTGELELSGTGRIFRAKVAQAL